MNWVNEGRQAAFWSLDHPKSDLSECPWPIHTEEGSAWIRGWNEIAIIDDLEPRLRFDGNCLVPQEID